MGEVSLNAQALCALVENPSDYSLEIVSFDEPKAIYVKELCGMFNEKALAGRIDSEKITYGQIVDMMLSWYRGLPKYSREKKINVDNSYIRFMNELKNAFSGSQKFLFVTIPEIFKTDDFSNSLCKKVEEVKSSYEGFLTELEESLVSLSKKILKEKIPELSERDSLCQCYKKFYTRLTTASPEIVNYKFENGAETLFSVFENCGPDEVYIVRTLAPALCGINTVDWNDSTIESFEKRLREFVDTISAYVKCARDCRGGVAVAERSGAMKRKRNPEKPGDMSESEWQVPRKLNSNEYRILFADESFSVHFEKIECSKKAESLEKEMFNILDEYGQSVSKSEKREVLMAVLKELCK